LPPREITGELAERIGKAAELTENQLVAATLLSHFAYGAAAGATFGLFQKSVPLANRLKGVLAGLMLWAGSYLGWLPAMKILKPATQHPWRRNLLMILAHVVWGLTLGEVNRKLQAGNRSIQV
jgi:uncharacterized membrane protein YagU involved in acid resistance